MTEPSKAKKEEAIAIIDRDHSYRFVSGAYAKLLGVPQQELLGHRVAESLGPELYERFSVPALERCFSGRTHRDVAPLPSLDGLPRLVDIEYHPLVNPEDVQAVVLVATEASTEGPPPRHPTPPPPHVAHERRLVTMGSAVAAAVHDLGNALSAISMNLDSLGNKALGTDEAIIEARLACAYSRKLIASLTQLGQPPEEARPVPIVPLVRHVAATLRAAWPPGIDIEFAADDPTIEVVGDELGLSRVLANLYTNAAKSMSDTGGVIEAVVIHTRIRVPIMTDTGAIEAGAYCVIEVSDTGCGIQEEVRGTMFQPFVTSNRSEGSGLGLAVAKAIVLDHGGGIVVESQPGAGSTFSVFLPIRESAAPPHWNSILSIPPPATK